MGDRDTWSVLYLATQIWEGGASAETALMGVGLRQPCSVLAFSSPHLDCKRKLTLAQIVQVGEVLQLGFMPGTLNLRTP